MPVTVIPAFSQSMFVKLYYDAIVMPEYSCVVHSSLTTNHPHAAMAPVIPWNSGSSSFYRFPLADSAD